MYFIKNEKTSAVSTTDGWFQLSFALGKTGVLDKLYYVRFADENVSGSVIETFGRQ